MTHKEKLEKAREQCLLAQRTPYQHRNEYLDAVVQVAIPLQAEAEYLLRKLNHANAVLSDITEAVFGEGVDDDATYPAVVGKLLVDEIQVQVLNFGVGGHDFQQIVSYIRDSTSIYNPDYVILTLHAGDFISSDFFLYNNNKIKPQST